MSRKKIIRENPYQSFLCQSCGQSVAPVLNGGKHRNHCPHCLCSFHVDILPGDRRASCRGIMKPISIWIRKGGEWSLIHRCEKCGTIRSNRVASDDNETVLFTLAASFLTQLPFPANRALGKIQERNIMGE